MRPARGVFATSPGCGCRLEQVGVFADQGGVDLVGLVAAEIGTADVADLGWVGDADKVACVVQRQRRARL